VLMPGAGLGAAAKFAENLREVVGGSPFDLPRTSCGPFAQGDHQPGRGGDGAGQCGVGDGGRSRSRTGLTGACMRRRRRGGTA